MSKHRWIQTVAALWVCSSMMGGRGQGASQTAAVDGWPEQIDGRTLSRWEYGLVYTGDKAASDQVQEVLATVIADVKQDNAGAVPAGMVLVVNAEEEYPYDVTRLSGALTEADPNDSLGTLKAVRGAERQSQDMGLDTVTILSTMPLPIPVPMLREIAADLPADVERQIAWCIIVPTDGCLKANFKKIIDAAMKKEKPGLAKRAMLRAMMPVVERQVMSMMKKGRQAALYAVLLHARKDLSPEQRRAKVDAYNEKLGLKSKPDPAKEGER